MTTKKKPAPKKKTAPKKKPTAKKKPTPRRKKVTLRAKAHLEVKNHQAAIERVRKGLQIALLKCAGPSKQSGIRQISDKCAIVNSGSLLADMNWSAESYMFSQQYYLLAKTVVGHGDAATMVKRLIATLNEGKIVRGGTGGTLKLHPEVIENVRAMLKEAV